MKEIEIKWLIYEDGTHYSSPKFWQICPADTIKELKGLAPVIGRECSQHYLDNSDGVRLLRELGTSVGFVPDTFRLRTGELTLKSGSGYSRQEMEIEIDEPTYNKYLALARDSEVRKYRIRIPIDIGLDDAGIFEIDVYTDLDLVVCELELPNVDCIDDIKDMFDMGLDISLEPRYKNRSLAFEDK